MGNSIFDSGLLWLVAIAGLLVAAIHTFNRLIRARNQCRNAWASVDVNLTKRHDLVPNLVAVVKGYTDHEKALLERVVQLRNQAQSTRSEPTGMGVEHELGRALVLLGGRVEAYPDLKADQQFLHLSASLNEIEEQISASRRAYNAAVMESNNLVEQFPTNIVASVTGFGLQDFFSAEPVARSVPGVSR